MGGEDVCWDYVVNFFEFDRSQSNRLAPKLTKKHINIPAFKEMHVNLATQIMSHTVAAGMTTLKTLGKLPENAETTIEFISFFNKLFDLFNSRSTTSKSKSSRPFSSSSKQQLFMDEAEETLSTIKSKRTSRLPCNEGWLIAL